MKDKCEFTGQEAINGFDRKWMDKDGYEHHLKAKDGRVWHESNHPQCGQCLLPLEIIKSEHSYTEICPSCGCGTGDVW